MRKNPNKKEGNWGALKSKPQNLVPFKKGGTTKQIDMKKQLTKKENGGTPPKIKTKTVTTNPGGYSKTIVKTKTIDRPGKQGTVSTTKTRPTIKGVASDYASGVRKSVYGFKEAVDNKRTEMKKTRVARDMKKAGISPRPINPEQGGAMKKGGSVKKYQVGGPMKKASPTPPMMSPYMDKASKAKMVSPKTKAMEGQFKNTPPKKKPLASGFKQLKKGGSVRKYQDGGATWDQVIKQLQTAEAPRSSLQDLQNIQDARRGLLDPKAFASVAMKDFSDNPTKAIMDAGRVIAKKQMANEKYKRAYTPSDVLKKTYRPDQDPKEYTPPAKKKGGIVKKKKK